MKALQFIILAAFFSLLVYASLELPSFGEVDAPLHRTSSAVGSLSAGAYYLSNAYRDTRTSNVVTVVLGDYRAFDTLGETVVVFAAGIACALILGRRKP